MPHAVEDGDDHGLGSDGWPDLLYDRLECCCLDRDEDGIGHRAEAFWGDEPRRDDLRAAGADDPQAALAENLRAPLGDQERHVASRLGEAAAEISAGRAGADDQNAHIRFLRCGCIAATAMASASVDPA